tara:strand:+ start:187 stop:408 length:222 start_codon:yes stop_codon:yes gene_type:complete
MFNKECLTGILISYVVMDILIGALIYKKSPEVLGDLKETIDDNQKMVMLLLFVSLVVGCLLSNCYGCHKLFKW